MKSCSTSRLVYSKGLDRAAVLDHRWFCFCPRCKAIVVPRANWRTLHARFSFLSLFYFLFFSFCFDAPIYWKHLSLSLSLSQSIYSPLHCFFSNGVALRKRSIWITISLELIDINWFWHWFERIDFESIKILLFLGNKINIQSIWKQFP